jgi:CRP/FNR family transcriptional regulator
MDLQHEPEATAAIARSSLRELPQEVIDRLTDGAVLRVAPAGSTRHPSGGPPFAEVVVSGLMRAFVIAPTGRTMTIRYCRPGALMGTGTLFNDTDPRARGSTSALVESCILVLSPETVRALAEHDIRVTRALLRETSARVAEYINELETSAFGSLRQRLARHLLGSTRTSIRPEELTKTTPSSRH